MKNHLSFSQHIVIGVMLFALFFGAGNLIFPAALGQYSGDNVWFAIGGFLVTGIGLPLLGILAIGFSGSKSLQDLAGKVHPVYGLIFTSLLYLTIGPLFAAPRTAAVAYEVGIIPLLSSQNSAGGSSLFLFTLLFFGTVLWLSLHPASIVDHVGKILAPAILLLLIVLLSFAVIQPLGSIGDPQGAYAAKPFLTGFLEGYNTMDALASLVFGILVIQTIASMGVKTRQGIVTSTVKSGMIAILFLGIIYVGIAYLGATSTERFGLHETGGPVLSEAASFYFGPFGILMLSILIILACLTTAIGLATACGKYFHSIFPKWSYSVFVYLFALISFVIANFGLAKIITISIPVLMFLYPPAIALIFLALLSGLFRNARLVYAATTAATLIVSVIDGFKTLCDLLEIPYFSWLSSILSFYKEYLPLYEEGLGWLVPAIVAMVLTSAWVRLNKE
ncbi:branched-chain amino acid transporter II carrier protein [Mesobacillus campisalis]|uniref:Branched-chain amino acid transport system carrier protein n=1 Tax=Mesobacillus campisalis TaxID=1408103 RepID=A0A0M2SVL5_9BACI|nr:branched-chain amino acid transport system II carrier protein [Mesobacillus campisalis]KKK37746.1 branched-chain amino acid transporter II carrier protein [Mesobacillus campisalis]